MFKCTATHVSIKQPYSPLNQQPKILESAGAGVSKSHGRSRKILGKMTNLIKAFQTIIFLAQKKNLRSLTFPTGEKRKRAGYMLNAKSDPTDIAGVRNIACI